jgi:hypothetical protein
MPSVSSETPQFELIGDLTDEAIEALATLLLSVTDVGVEQPEPVMRSATEKTPPAHKGG